MKRVLGLSLLLLASYTLNANAAVKMGKANPAPKSEPEQAALNALGEHLEVSYNVLSNLDDTFCKSYIQKGDCFSSRIQLRAKAQTIAATTSLYFSHIAPIRGFSSTSDIAIEHLNGDLHRLTFNKAVPPNTSVSVDVAAPFWHASRSDAMANYYLTLGELSPVVVAATTRVKEPGSGLLINQHTGAWLNEEQYKRATIDNMPLMDSEYAYEKLQSEALLASAYSEKVNTPPNVSQRVIPNVLVQDNTGNAITTPGIQFSDKDAELLAPARAQMAFFGLQQHAEGLMVSVLINGQSGLRTAEQAKYADNGYELVVSETGIEITADNTIAANYALLTLMQLYNHRDNEFPATYIKDSPRYDFRGMHMDVARHFPGKQAVKNVITQMFTYKLNTLHLHLSDDEGWRIEIESLPELTNIGAYRCHDLSETQCLLPQLGSGPHRSAVGNGYLSKEDYIELVRYAHQRGIEIIPSLDMPGHARAAIVSMNARYHRLMKDGKKEAAAQYLLVDKDDTTRYESVQFYTDNTVNPCLDSTFTFIDTVMREIKALHIAADVPLKRFHIGADETAGAWTQSPVCQANGVNTDTILPAFVTRVQQLATKAGLEIGGWSDGMEKAASTLDNESAYTNVWHLLAAGGNDTVAHFANEDIPVVLSFPDVLYFDFPYASHPHEPGYYWGSKATSSEKIFSFMPENLPQHSSIWQNRMGNDYETSDNNNTASVIGIQGQLWSEVTVNQDAVEYMLFPRLLALAERAWHQSAWQQSKLQQSERPQSSVLNTDNANEKDTQRHKAWINFRNALYTQHIPALVKQGINLRVPTPAAAIKEQHLVMKQLPGLVNEYSIDGQTWREFTQPFPLPVNSSVHVRTKVAGTQSYSRALVL
ncbi:MULTISPECIES: family 20 glycosylhydrolase [unclassified Alteromonas]|uniref:family 20 glycosylhydrolase n=1 Tax=unclassified Alteromonas TaxID=2614992 RepID=UPI000AA233F7|nr:MULTISPECIES: family 20 glycosylhydrolase [unclassified Alteromonas]